MPLPIITRLAAVRAAAEQGLLVMGSNGAIVVLGPDGPVFDASAVVDQHADLFDLVERAGQIRVVLR